MQKTIIITGSTDGIGKLAAIRLAQNGHQIIIHGRNSTKVNNVVSSIKSMTNNNAIQGCTMDLSDLDKVKEKSIELKEKLPKVDIIINNAGVFKSPTAITKHGIDLRMVVNYIAPVTMTEILLPSLRESTDGRIINLSSAAQASVSLDFLKGNTTVSTQEAYAQSKLAILMWSFHLAAVEKELSIVALNPGSLLNTNMVREAYGRFWSPAEKGGDIIYDLAEMDNLNQYSGQYYDNDKGDWGDAHPEAYDQQKIDSLMRATKALIQK